ncbi:MAG: phosphatase PAP2 family protein [Bacteroidales bacterium]|jgi:membrane-associated phospholipid phosphatase
MKKLIALLVILMPMSLFSQNMDIDILKAIHSPEPLPSDDFFRFISNSNVYVYAGTPVTMAVVGLVGHDNDLLRNAAVMAAGTAVAYGVTLGLKHTVKRERPFLTYPDDIVNKSGIDWSDSYSFPSGHSTMAFATATALSLEYPKWYVIVPSYAYAGTVAYSRMHLGVHYPSDVLTGAIIGSGCAVLSHYVNKKLQSNSKRH